MKKDESAAKCMSGNFCRCTGYRPILGACSKADVIDIDALRSAGLINSSIRRAKVFASGEVTKAVTLRGIGATKGALAAIQAAGGSVEEQA